jgi:Tfp pilus assembly protein PilO
MKHLPKDKRERLLLVAVTALIVLVTIWQGLISLQKRKLSGLGERRLEQEMRVNNARRLVGSVDQFKQSFTVKSKELKELESTMASGDMYAWVITKINQFKTGYKVDIPQFSREVSTEVGVLADFPYRAALFNIRGRAFYHDFGRFLADFENAFPYLRVQNIELEAASHSKASTLDADNEHPEKLAFRMEIVTLINPNSP